MSVPQHLHPLVGWSSMAVPVVFMVVLVWAWAYDGPAVPAPRDGGGFVRHFIHYGLFKGYTAGFPERPLALSIPRERLEPGDVILGGNPGAVYGEWSHATIYLGDGQVLVQDLLRGISIGELDELAWYDHLRIIRPMASATTRAEVAQTARHYVGGLFNLMSHPQDPWQWTCSRCVHDAYLRHGIHVSDGRFWITPDALARSDGAIIVEH
jgi:hypothetical protein